MGVDVNYDKCKITWESFISIYCLLKLNSATPEEYITFMCKVMDPFKAERVPEDQYKETLDALFKGQFKLKGEDGKDGMSADINRELEEKGIINEIK